MKFDRRLVVVPLLLGAWSCGSNTPVAPEDPRGVTPLGTPYLVRDITPGPSPSHRVVSPMVDAGGALVFLAGESGGQAQLWRSDGTEERTAAVADVGAVPTWGWSPKDLEWVAPYVYFAGSDDAHGRELWRSDGTAAGTTLVAEMIEGRESQWLGHFSRLGSTLFFARSAHETRERRVRWELMKTDGSASGTVLVKDLGLYYESNSHRSSMTAGVELEGRLFFRVNDAIWRSDGTSEGTIALARRLAPYYDTFAFMAGRHLLFFLTGDSGVPNALWTSDGTPGGTAVLRDLGMERPGALGLAGATPVFAAAGSLWTSDGTIEGTHPIMPLAGEFMPLASAGDVLFFRTGSELWRTDGRVTGTLRLAGGFKTFYYATSAGARLFFTADDGLHGDELWTSDGTPQGTTLVTDLRPGLEGASPTHLTAAGSRLFFWANDGRTGRELWAVPFGEGAR
jgi:ELWxxDGT repeat protein